MDEATKKKISKALRGRPKPPRSEEHKHNLSKAFLGRSYIDRFGKERAKIVKQKIINANTGKKRAPRSEEWKRKLSNSLRGRSVWNKGKKGLQKAWNKTNIPRDFLYNAYITEEKVASSIAEEFDVSKSVIYRAAREYSFPCRSTREVIGGKTFEEIYGEERAREIKKKISENRKGKEVTWGDKISEALKEHYKINGFSEERKRNFAKHLRKRWKDPEYRKKVIAGHKRYLKEHPEELVRLRNIQYPGHATKIELKVRNFLNQFLEENIHFYYDKYDKTKQTFFRPDFQFPDKNIIIELDGYYTHFTEEGRKKDIHREEELKKAGWKIFRFTQREIDQNFDEVKSKICDILEMGKIIAGADEAGRI